MKRTTPKILPEVTPSLGMRVMEPISWQKNIDFIKNLILDRNIMIALLGEKESGKSTFLQFLPARLAPLILTYRLNATAFMDKTAFLQQLHRVLRLGEGRSLKDFVIDCMKQRTHVLLIIDDAHHLTSEWISMLLKEMVDQDQEAYFHIFISAELSIIPSLNALAKETYQDRIHSIEVGQLSEDETKNYLRQYFLLHQPQLEVTEEKLNNFYQLTSGRIADIHKQYEIFFADEFAIPVEERGYKRVVVMACLGCVALGVAYLAQSGMLQSLQSFLNAEPQQFTEQDKTTVVIEPTLLSAIPSYTIAIRQPLFPAPLQRAELAIVDKEVAESADEAMAVMDKVIVAPKVLPKVEEKVELTEKVLPKEAAVANKSEYKLKANSAEVGLYTIQLLASSNHLKLKQFVAHHHLNGKTQVHQIQRKGKVWYVLTLGSFSNRLYADQAITQLPHEVVHFKPWVRSINELKNG